MLASDVTVEPRSWQMDQFKRDSVYAEDFLQNGIVSIGWSELGPIEPDISKEVLEKQYRQGLPKQSDGEVRVGLGQVYRYLNDIKPGDRVITYDRDKRLYYLGEILSETRWSPESIEGMPRSRKVQWSRRVSRDKLTAEARNSLGAIQTLFQVKASVAKELEEKSVAIDAPEEVEEVETTVDEETALLEQQIRTELIEKAEEAIEDRIVRLDWEEMQQLVAGILQAMGYRTTVSRRGPDRGHDVFASPDGLGLEEPRIFVEVKHRPNSSIGAQDVRSFLGGRSAGDRCLYVSTGGFTKDARYEADRANVPLKLLGLVDLRKLLVDYYENLDEETRSMIPLKRIFVLAD
jgi:restriction system protein